MFIQLTNAIAPFNTILAPIADIKVVLGLPQGIQILWKDDDVRHYTDNFEDVARALSAKIPTPKPSVPLQEWTIKNGRIVRPGDTVTFNGEEGLRKVILTSMEISAHSGNMVAFPILYS